MTTDLYDSLKEAGYDFFNENDPFYNDPCSVYNSVNNTDITLADRKQIYLDNNGNITFCQAGCQLEHFDSKTKKAKCNCSPPENNTMNDILDPSFVKFGIKLISDTFLETITNSNYIVLKCYKLALDFSTIWTNIGRICMIIILLLSLISMFFFYFKDSKNIDNILKSLFDSFHYKLGLDKVCKQEKKENKKGNKTKVNKNNKNICNSDDALKKKNNGKKIKRNESAPPKRNIKKKDNIKGISTSKNENNSNSKLDLNDFTKNKNVDINKHNNIKILKINKVNIVKLYKSKNSTKCENQNIYINTKKKQGKKKNKKKKNKILRSIALPSNRKINLNDVINKDKKAFQNFNNLNDYELDTLEYEEALTIDKRTYSQYYLSLLKRKHILLFTLCQSKDYNFVSIKISLFLLSFSSLLTVTGLFFDNQSMHNIFIDNGEYNFFLELPKIIITSIITTLVNIFLKVLSLTEKNFLDLKKEKKLKKMIESSKDLKKFLQVKFICFYIISHLLLLFFLYFISCFCSIYPNTQIILICDTIISFGLSMLYPFGLYLLPGMFRISALRAPKKDKDCLYKLGQILSLL